MYHDLQEKVKKAAESIADLTEKQVRAVSESGTANAKTARELKETIRMLNCSLIALERAERLGHMAPIER